MAGNPAPGFARKPDYSIEIEPIDGRIEAILGGEAVADSTSAVLLREGTYAPAIYFPRGDVTLGPRTERSTHCPFKGDASYWTLEAGGRTAADAAWSYEQPFDEMAAIRDYVSFYGDRIDGFRRDGKPVDPGTL